MRKVQIYVENKRIDLFEDEKIQVKSSVQNISDISKVFTDFSQSFTVPASDNNNAIFGFYYNNDLNEFNANTRVDCRIEIDLAQFRKGRLQLEGSTVKDNQVQSYNVTFYGEVVSLKDRFADDKLSDLDYTSLSFEWSGANVQNSITSPTYQDIRFPLISSSRVWTYGTAGVSPDDISVPAYPVDYTELFPAISDSKIFDLISSTYGLTFTGNFLSNDRLNNSYTWWKNRETANFTSEPVDLEFNPFGLTCDADLPNNTVGVNEVNVEYINMSTFNTPPLWQSWGSAQFHELTVFINPTTTVTYYLDTYKDGSFENSSPAQSGSQSFTILNQGNLVGLDSTYTFKLRSIGTITFDFTVSYTFTAGFFDTSNNYNSNNQYSCQYSTAGVVTVNVIDFASSAPDIKVLDWFTGTLNEFNLTCLPTDALTFQIEPLENWYANGQTIDITKYVDTDSIKVDRAKMYNEISFEWQKSKSFMNTAYAGINGKEYGNLREIFPNNDGGKYAIKLPFETILFNNFGDIFNNIQVAYSLTDAPDYKPYIPKPVKLYLNESKPCYFWFDNGASVLILDYMPFGQSTVNNSTDYSMNFGSEFDTLNPNNNITNSLYKTYYEAYLLNLFYSKTRKVTLKCVLPLGVLTDLTLDDAIIVRDKKYRINDMTSDLTSGVVSLVLLSDWNDSSSETTTIYNVVSDANVVTHSVNVPLGGYVTVAAPIEPQFITTVPTIPNTFYSAFNLVANVPLNTSGVARTQTIVITGYSSSGVIVWTNTVIIVQAASSSFLLYEGLGTGYILQEDLNKILL